MKPVICKIILILVSLILLSFYGCNQKPDCNILLARINSDIEAGNLRNVAILADSLRKCCPDAGILVHKADSLAQIAERIGLDFSITEEQVISRLNKSLGSFSPADKSLWEKTNWLEWRIINGEKRYFNRAASNLVLLKDFNLFKAKRDTNIAREKDIIFRKNHTESILKVSGLQSLPVVPVDMKIEYTTYC